MEANNHEGLILGFSWFFTPTDRKQSDTVSHSETGGNKRVQQGQRPDVGVRPDFSVNGIG